MIEGENIVKKINKIINIKKEGMNIMKRSLNLSKITGKKTTVISSEEALKDIIPINWSQEVVQGTKKILVCGTNK